VVFTITEPSGTEGFLNLTIPITAIPYGTSPVVYIDGQQALNQNYTQDGNNFYVWFTTQFNTNQVTIQFSVPANPTTKTFMFEIVGLNVAVIIVIIAMIIIIRRKTRT